MTRCTVLLACCLALAIGCGSDEKKPKDEAPKAEDQGAPLEGKIVGQEVTYEAGGVTLKGYLAYDNSSQDKRPGVIVVHEWWGHNDYARSRARKLAELGYTALAVDMYGDGKTADHPEDAQKFMKELMGDLPTAVARFEAGRKLLQEHATVDSTRIAAIGYCMGGGVVLHMARIGMDLKGVASFHGALMKTADAKQGDVKAKLLVCNGAADPFSPAEAVDAFKKEMDAAGADMKIVAYEGAQHGFTNPKATEMGEKFKLPLAYQKEADEASWAELEAFLTDVFAQ